MHYVKPVDYQLHLNYNDVDHVIHVPYNPFVADITRFLNSSGDNALEYVSPLPSVNVIAEHANAYFEANNIKIIAKGYEPMALEASGITPGVNEGANRGILMRGIAEIPANVNLNVGVEFKIDGRNFLIGFAEPKDLFRYIATNRSVDNNAVMLGGTYYPVMVEMIISTTTGVVANTSNFKGASAVDDELGKLAGLTISTVRLELLSCLQTFGTGNNATNPFSTDLPIDFRSPVEYTIKYIYSSTVDGNTFHNTYYPDFLNILPGTFPGAPPQEGAQRIIDFVSNPTRPQILIQTSGTFSAGAVWRDYTDSHTDYGRNGVVEQLNFKAATGVLKMLRPDDAPRYLITAPRLVDVEPGDVDHSKVCVLNDYLPYGVVMDFNTSTRTTIVPD